MLKDKAKIEAISDQYQDIYQDINQFKSYFAFETQRSRLYSL